MTQQLTEIRSPLSGINRAMDRSDQPPNTCWDCLNVLPFDRFGRMRAAQRSGTSEPGGVAGTHTILGLHQVVLGQESGTADVWSSANSSTGAYVASQSGNLEALSPSGRYQVGTKNGTPSIANYVAFLTSGQITNSTSTRAESGSSTTGLHATGSQATFTVSGHNAAGVITMAVRTFAISVFDDIGSVLVTKSSSDASSVFFLSLRINLGTMTDTSELITLRLDAAASTATLYRNTTVIGSASGQSVFPAAWWITTIGSTVNVYTGEDAGAPFDPTINGTNLPVITATVANPGSAYFGYAFGGGQPAGGSTTTALDMTDTTTDSSPAEILFTAGDPSNPREVKLIAVSGHDVYLGDPTLLTLIGNGVTNGHTPGITDLFGFGYIVDGTETLQVDLVGATVIPFTPANMPVNCRVARAWRGRLLLAAADDDQQNIAASRSGDTTDWDISQTDPAAAWELNAGDFGRLDDIILDVIPFSDDNCWIMGDHTIWALMGDPAAGGSLINISRQIGIAGTNGWTFAPDGTLWFIGTGGLYHATNVNQPPELVSGTSYPQFFQALDRKNTYFRMAYDRDRFGMFIFITDITAGGTSTHLWWDARTNGLYPLSFPDVQGPTSTLVWDGDRAQDRFLLLGGRDGILRKSDPTAYDDDGTIISSYVVLGPFHPTDTQAVWTESTVTYGEIPSDQPTWNVVATMKSGITAYDVTEGTPKQMATVVTVLDRRDKIYRQRLLGEWFTLTLSNTVDSNYFSFEGAKLGFIPAGRQRRVR